MLAGTKHDDSDDRDDHNDRNGFFESGSAAFC
jgi:hypothetical protein